MKDTLTDRKCWWHPNKNATCTVNIGKVLAWKLPACDECAEQVKRGKYKSIFGTNG